MTTSTATSQSASLQIGTKLPAVKAPETSASAVIVLTMREPVRIHVRGTKPFSALVREFESNPQMASKLATARKTLANTVLKGDVATLRVLRLRAGLSQDQVAAR